MASGVHLPFLRAFAVAFWLACVVFVLVPSSHARHPVGDTFRQPAQPKLQILRFHA